MLLEVSMKSQYFDQDKRLKPCKSIKGFPDYPKCNIYRYSKFPDETAKIDDIN